MRSFLGLRRSFLRLPCGPGTSALKLRSLLRGARGKCFLSCGGGELGTERGAGLVEEDGVVTSLTMASTAARRAGSDSPCLIPADRSSRR